MLISIPLNSFHMTLQVLPLCWHETTLDTMMTISIPVNNLLKKIQMQKIRHLPYWKDLVTKTEVSKEDLDVENHFCESLHYDCEDVFAHEMAYHTIHKLYGLLYDMLYSGIRGLPSK